MGKGGGASPPQYDIPDNSAMMNSALQSTQANMQNMMLSSQQLLQQQLGSIVDEENYESNLPDIIGSQAAETDWQKKMDEIKAKSAADYSEKQRLKKGRASTILTSPLLDNSDPTTSKSIISGGNK
jgi:hypothetical protein